MTRPTKSYTTFEFQVEIRNVRYTVFAELDVITRDRTHDIEVTDWGATDAGEHEILDPQLKGELRAELEIRLITQRERILEAI